jgi:hypothetical protein
MKRQWVDLRRSGLALGAWAFALALAGTPSAGRADGASSDESDYDPFREFESSTPAGGGAPAPYRDRIISTEALEPLPPDEEEETLATGALRSAHVDLVTSHSRVSGESTDEYGIAFGGFRDFEDLGGLSVEGVVFRSDSERDDGQGWRGSATAWQRGLQMPGGWWVNNGLGVLNTPLPGLLMEQYRFFLPSVPLLGLSSEWSQPGEGLSWQAAAGRGGVFNGGLISGFETGDGNVASAGAQWTWSPQWDGAVSLLATDSRIVPDSQGLPDFQNGRTHAVVMGNRWRGAQDEISIKLQASDADAGQAAGTWFDARANRGAWTHRYGGYYLEPDLAWGAWPINNDVRGGYYRLDFSRARWTWNAGLDRIDSISGASFDGWYGNGFVRYQASSRLGYGGGLSARESSGGVDAGDSAQSVQLFTDAQSRWGQTRAQYDYSRSDTTRDNWELTLDHALRMRQGARLSVSAGYGELDDGNFGTSPSLTLSTYGGFNLANNLTLDGSVRWSRQRDTDESSGVDMSLGLRWQISPHWSLLADINENRGPRRSPFILDPLTNQPVLGTLPNDRSAYLSLRYDFSAGSARPVLGGPPGGASGTISGSVFLDDNGDGVRSASEQPARSVTVMLDNRFVVRTDDQGRFRFERVAVGTRTVAVIPDNLPLPWSLEGNAAQQAVSVTVRGDAVVDFGAQRPR